VSKNLSEVKQVLADTLQLGARAEALTADTQLLGNLPELDSMAVVGVVMALEERFDIVVDDDEISADTFTSLDTLASFVDRKTTT
jgi:acyl carrier protein